MKSPQSSSSSGSVRDLLRNQTGKSAKEAQTEPISVMRAFVKHINDTGGLSLEVDDQGSCLLESSEAMPVAITLHDEGRSLLLTALVAEPEGALSAELLRKLLEMNAYAATTLGGWLSLMPGSSRVLYQFEWRNYLAAEGGVLNNLLNSFIENSHTLQELIMMTKAE